jgi:hypothetical protein
MPLKKDRGTPDLKKTGMPLKKDRGHAGPGTNRHAAEQKTGARVIDALKTAGMLNFQTVIQNE